jgi:hypothetical protein
MNCVSLISRAGEIDQKFVNNHVKLWLPKIETECEITKLVFG